MYNVPNWIANMVFNPEFVSNDLWLNLTARYVGEQLSPVNIEFLNGTTFYEPNKETDDMLLFNTGFR